VYQNTDYFNVSYYNSQTNASRNTEELNFSRISIAVAINTLKHFTHEIEFFIPELSKSIYKVKLPLDYEFEENDGYVSSISTYSFRYELSKKVFSLSNRFQFIAGLGVNPYLTTTEYEPTMSNQYYSKVERYGVSFNIVPRIDYRVTDRIYIDLNIPLKVYDLQRKDVQNNNPNLPMREQKFNEVTDIFFENVYTIRLGVRYIFK